jgi:Asp-tRNA(Asn)/Glu-tRNA(Gln) amidotransferase A subunit family amidase
MLMHTGPLNEISAAAITRRITAGETTAEAVVEACLERIASREPSVHAFANLDPALARRHARELDRAPWRGPLHGVPIGVKDVLDTADLPTEMGSPIYRGYQPSADSAVVALARAAGAIILGKTVTAEFAGMAPGPTANPHNPAHTPGGSSSGSGAAVADFMVPVSLGTQTGGSILRPASYCGIIGYKPTFGAFNRAGLKLAAESLDTIGLLARSLDDVELLTAVLLGRQPASPQLLDSAPRVGLCRTSLWDQAQPETVAAIDAAIKTLDAAGARIRDVTLPDSFAGLRVAARESINCYERSKSLASEWHSQRELLSDRMQRCIRQGLEIRYEDYIAAVRLGETCRAQLGNVFDGLDVLLTPCTNGEAPVGLAHTGDPAFQAIWTILHVPAMSLPTHRGPMGLPVGIQLIAPRYKDEQLFACARWIWRRLGPA